MDYRPIKLSAKLGKKEPLHDGLHYRGQTVDWICSDTPESFNRMMQDSQHRAYFESQGWLEPGGIQYRINEHGFRGDNFDPGSYLLTLGCSFTMGIGLPEKDVWPYRLGTALGLRVANLSWGGAASDTCLRLALHWIPRLRPKIVVMLTPPPDRLEVCLDPDQAYHVWMPSGSDPKFGNDVWLKHWHLNDSNSQLNTLKNQLSIQQLCANMEIPCMIYHCWNEFSHPREILGYARDYLHAGAVGHEILTKRIINDWDETKRR